MLTKRVIPCMDVTNGRVVKGINFVDLRDAGDPVELAKVYDREGADEVVFLDITATSDDRATTIDLASRAAAELRIPYTVGGGFRDHRAGAHALAKGLVRNGRENAARQAGRGFHGRDGGEIGRLRMGDFLFQRGVRLFFVHGSSICRRVRSAWNMRDLTVPTGTPRISATSA